MTVFILVAILAFSAFLLHVTGFTITDGILMSAYTITWCAYIAGVLSSMFSLSSVKNEEIRKEIRFYIDHIFKTFDWIYAVNPFILLATLLFYGNYMANFLFCYCFASILLEILFIKNMRKLKTDIEERVLKEEKEK